MSGNLQTVVLYCFWEAGREWDMIDCEHHLVQHVSTGTFCTFHSDLPPPSYLGYPPSFIFTIARASIHKQKKTLLSWTELCAGSVSPVSTGTLRTLPNDLPPPFYPGYPPSFLFTITRACIQKQKKLCWTELTFVQTLYPLFPLGPSALSSMICHLHPTLDIRPLFSYILPCRAGIHNQKKTLLKVMSSGN